MVERVLPENLSGQEVRLAILDKIGAALQKDCFLSPNTSYEKFYCKVKIEIRLTDVGRQPEVHVEQVAANVSNPEDACLDAAEAEFEIQADSPNTLRVETGQPVPVLSRDGEGKPEVKRVKYARKATQKAVE